MVARATQQREREVKLEAKLDLALPDLRPLVGGTVRLAEERLDAAYFDTPDFRLWERGLTFRHRLGEGPEPGTWTLKLPAAHEAAGSAMLDRTEVSWPGAREQIPEGARRLLQGLVRHAELDVVVELHTERRPLELHDGHGRPIAVLDDDTVTVHGGPRDGLRFREVEVELADAERTGPADPDESIAAVVRALQQAGARRQRSPKMATALGLEPGSRVLRPVHLDRNSTLETLVRRTLHAGLDRLLQHEIQLRLDPTRPPVVAVHQARVATRRLRSDLATFSPALDEVWVRHTRDDLKWVGTALGRVRDLDVLTETFSRPEKGPPIDAAGRRELLSRVADQRRLAADELAALLDNEARYLRLLDRLDAAVAAPPFRSGRSRHDRRRSARRDPRPDNLARRVMPRLVAGSWRSLRRRVRGSGSTPSNRDLHRVRIKAKQLRYAAEAAAPVIGKRARRTAEKASSLQTVLGDFHDAVTAEEWLWNEALRSSPWGSFSAGQFTAAMRQRQRALRRRWPKQWRKLDRPKLRRWLA